jgi:hypothetical protein
MRAMAFSTGVVVLLTWPALAETAPPAAAPAPVLDIPCDGFARNPDGSWTPTRDVNIPDPGGGGVVTVGSAVSFRPGVPFRGLDLADVLERQCAAR